MKMTKERKVYAAVLGLAAAGFSVDRLFLGGGPQVAQADTAPLLVNSTPAIPESTPPATPIADAPAATASLALRVKESATAAGASESEIIDAFKPTGVWAGKAPVAAPVAGTDLVEVFRSAHRLTAVVTGGANTAAVVNGRLIKPGQTLDGFTLVSVRSGAAVFESPAGRVALKTGALTGNSQQNSADDH